jgi:hypothetical protein
LAGLSAARRIPPFPFRPARPITVAFSLIYGRISSLSDGLIFLTLLGSLGLAAPGLIPIDLSLTLAFSPAAFSQPLSFFSHSLSASLALHSFVTLSPSGHFGSRGASAGRARRNAMFATPAHAAACSSALSHALG